MTGPVWDGTGRDPWLPRRLDAALEVAETEEDIRSAVWAALQGWLVQVSRRVLRSGRPDPDAVFALEPTWREIVLGIVRGQVLKAVGKAFVKLFGSGYRYDQRPFVTAYLAEVTNRLVRVADEVYDLVAREMAIGVNLGEGIPELAARVDVSLSTTASERWPNRATVIARTEAIGALNAGRHDAFRAYAADSEEELFQVWLATADSRTRETHRLADGQRVPLGEPFEVGGFSLRFPGDPSGPPQEVIQCVPGNTLVQFPGLRAALRRRYQGQMVRIKLSSGDELSITPNHPVLRANGLWTPAGEVVEGDQLVRTLPGRKLPGEPYPGHAPTMISKVHGAAGLTAMTRRVALTPPDLHGDAPKGYVQVVTQHRYLTPDLVAASDEEVRQFGLTLADLATLGGGRGQAPASLDHGGQEILSDPTGTPGDVRRAGLSAPGAGVELGHAEPVGLAGSPDGNAQLVQLPDDGRSADAEGQGNCVGGLPAFVALAEVVKVELYGFQGHVFNLDTGHGWYSANSIITRNCRCTSLLVDADEVLDLSNRQMKR